GVVLQLPACRDPHRRPEQVLQVRQRRRPFLLQEHQVVIRNLLPLRSLHHRRRIPLPVDQPDAHPHRQNQDHTRPNRRLLPVLHPPSLPPNSQLTTHNSQLTTHNSQLTTESSPPA